MYVLPSNSRNVQLSNILTSSCMLISGLFCYLSWSSLTHFAPGPAGGVYGAGSGGVAVRAWRDVTWHDVAC